MSTSLVQAHVILACRDTTKAEILREEIIRDNIEGQATALELDLSDFNSIRRFARRYVLYVYYEEFLRTYVCMCTGWMYECMYARLQVFVILQC